MAHQDWQTKRSVWGATRLLRQIVALAAPFILLPGALAENMAPRQIALKVGGVGRVEREDALTSVHVRCHVLKERSDAPRKP
jgi:hypothetical protein